MKKVITLMLTASAISVTIFLSGCSNSDSYSGTSYYRDYHDPYPYWGRRTVYVRHDDHDKPNRPDVRPPGSRPPNIGRPPNRPSRPVHRPAQRPARRR